MQKKHEINKNDSNRDIDYKHVKTKTKKEESGGRRKWHWPTALMISYNTSIPNNSDNIHDDTDHMDSESTTKMSVALGCWSFCQFNYQDFNTLVTIGPWSILFLYPLHRFMEATAATSGPVDGLDP